jgi:multimeric flavodoxin WrbA
MKLFLDRLRPYIASKKLQGKRAVLVVPSEEGAEACGCLVKMFELSFHYLGVELAAKLLVKAYEKAEIKEQPSVLDDGFAVGKNLK